MEVSWRRPTAMASRRLATLAQAMRRTRRTTARRIPVAISAG